MNTKRYCKGKNVTSLADTEVQVIMIPEVGFVGFSVWFCWLQIEEENIVFRCSCKCHTTNLFKVQTLKVGNQLENFLLFCPLEQSCDIRGKRLTFTQQKTTNQISKQQKSEILQILVCKSFFCNFKVKGLDEDPLFSFHFFEAFYVFIQKRFCSMGEFLFIASWFLADVQYKKIDARNSFFLIVHHVDHKFHERILFVNIKVHEKSFCNIFTFQASPVNLNFHGDRVSSNATRRKSGSLLLGPNALEQQNVTFFSSINGVSGEEEERAGEQWWKCLLKWPCFHHRPLRGSSSPGPAIIMYMIH